MSSGFRIGAEWTRRAVVELVRREKLEGGEGTSSVTR